MEIDIFKVIKKKKFLLGENSISIFRIFNDIFLEGEVLVKSGIRSVGRESVWVGVIEIFW